MIQKIMMNIKDNTLNKIGVFILIIGTMTSNGYAQKSESNNLKKGIAAYSPNGNSNVDTRKIIPFHLLDGFILIDGEVNGVKGKFMFDTGTPFDFFLNDEKIHLDTAKVVGKGAAASGQPIVVYNSNEKTTIRLEGMDDDITQNNNFHTQLDFISKGIDANLIGTLGFGFLKNYEFAINYDTQLITLYPIDEKGNLLVEKSIGPSNHKIIIQFHNEEDKRTPEIDVDVCGQKIPASFDTESQGSIRLSDKMLTSLKQKGCLTEIKGFHYGRKDDSATIIQLQDISFQGKSLGRLDNLYLESHKGNDEISLGYTFLRNYISIWNFKKRTIELINQE